MVIHQLPIALPVLAALGGAVIGFFVPDLQLRGQAGGSRSDAGAALLTYIDLVTLERLANASATQALHNARMLAFMARRAADTALSASDVDSFADYATSIGAARRRPCLVPARRAGPTVRVSEAATRRGAALV